MKSIKEDLTFGKKGEVVAHTQLEELTGGELSHSGQYAVLDFSNKDKTVYVELKTRRHLRNAYPTTIVGMNKIKFCSDPKKTYYFAFNFLDGLHYIKYDKELFATFGVDLDYWCGYRVGCINRRQQVINIPVSALTKWETTKSS
jgi:hypothetical protein